MYTSNKTASASAELRTDLSQITSNTRFQQSRLKSKTPLVSVVIPVYNGSKYIQTAIESVLKQTYSNYEIIVIDDGSKDDTHQKLKKYQSQITYIFQENQGSAAARNVGINLSKGELVAFLDSDDFWTMPEKLAKQVDCFNNDPSAGCINTGWQIIDSVGKHIKSVQPWHKAPKLDLETWLKKKCVRTSAMIFRREWLEKIGGFDPELKQSHDVDLILRLSLEGCKAIWLREDTVAYRQHEDNTTKNSIRQAKYVQSVLDKFFSRNDLPEHIAKVESRCRYNTLVWLAWYQYRANALDEMIRLLQKSLNFSPYLRAESISHWLTSFDRFSSERGERFNANVLTGTPQWQQLIILALRLKKDGHSSIAKEIQNNGKKINDNDNVSGLIRDSSQSKESRVIDNNLHKQKETSKKETSKGNSKEIAKENSKEIARIDLNLAKKNNQNSEFTTQKTENISVVEKANLTLKKQIDLAETFYSKRQFRKAADHYQKAIKIQSEDWNLYYKLGCVFLKMKLWNKSINEYYRSIELNPDFSWSYYNLGRNFEQLGRDDEAIFNYQKAFEIDHHVEVSEKFNLLLSKKIHHCRGRMKNDDDAAKKYRELIEIRQSLSAKEIKFKSEKVQQYREKGDLLSKDGKFNDAADAYRKALELHYNDWALHQKLAHVLLKQKKWADSINECQKVIELNPEFIWSHYNLGRNFHKIGNWKEAISCYLNALKISYKSEIHRDLELLLDEKINYYQNSLQDDIENLKQVQKMLDIKGMIKIEQHKEKKQKSKQILSGFSNQVKKRKRILCLMFMMNNCEFTESINFILYHMYENGVNPIIFTDSVETGLLFKNNVVFEYFPLSEKPAKFSDREWQQYFKDRVSNLVLEWSPQKVLNFSNTLNKELSHTLLSIV